MSSFHVKEYIEKIYSNVYYIATRERVDLERAIRQAEQELNELYSKEDSTLILERSKCLVYIELLARYIRSSLIEIVYLRESDRDSILHELLDAVCHNDLEVKDFENIIGSVFVKFSIPCSNYKLVFSRNKIDNPPVYKLYLNRVNDQNHSEFFPDEICLEENTGGYLAEIVERVLERYRKKSYEKENHETRIVEKLTNMNLKRHGNPTEEELTAYIYNDTRTIELLDQFEGYGEYKGSPAFKRIVICNPKYGEFIGDTWVSYNLVIERSNSYDYVGDITFTEFKQNNDYDLREFIKKEITSEILEAYLDKNKFYRFKKPYHLRAQNSSNRVGYGWQWNWAGGYGDYTEGTEYGETTNYVFAGAYITSGYSYRPDNRTPFSKCKDEPLESTEFQVIPYLGDVRDIEKGEIQECYVLTEINGNIKSYTSVFVASGSQNIYVPENDYNTSYAVFIQNTLVLHQKNGFEDKEIRVLKPIARDTLKESTTAEIENLRVSSKSIEYSVVPFEGNLKSIIREELTREYIYVEQEITTALFVPVFIDEEEKYIYIEEGSYLLYKDAFKDNTLSICKTYNSIARQVRIVIDQSDKNSDDHNKLSSATLLSSTTHGIDKERNAEKSSDSFSEAASIAKQQLNKRVPEKLEVVKSGNYCPSCGRSNTQNYSHTVTDSEGRSHVIQVRKCLCGKIYLTNKLRKKLPSTIEYVVTNRAMPPKTHQTKIKTVGRTVVCPKCKSKCSSLFGNKGMCWDCYKEEMNSMFE